MNLGEGSQPQSNLTTKMTVDQIHARVETHSEPDVTTQTDSDTNKQTYNILLIRETGVGKSTFVNAFFYYMTYESLDDALKAQDITALVPTRFTVMDDNSTEKLIVYGEDPNESITPGASTTRAPRSYTFNVENSIIRLIDTPGIGDTRGMNMDEKYFDRLLVTIGELKDIHAICIMLKPNSAQLIVVFQNCMKQLLSRLQKSASRNIIFLFTNSRGTLYHPGDTAVPLKAILKEIAEQPPKVVIPFEKENIFCIDNEAFRFLVANKQGIYFNDDERGDFAASWNRSSKVCLSLLNYVIKSIPHKIQDTVSINEARRLVLRLSRLLAEITDNIDTTLKAIRRYKGNLSNGDKTIEELKQKLYVPVLKLEVINLEHPRTVCTHASCVDVVSIGGSRIYNYRTICHKPCYLNIMSPKLVGNAELVNCAAMSGQYCKRCGHHYSFHMHITYESKTCEDIIHNKDVVSDIENIENHMQKLQSTVQLWEKRKLEYENERAIIQKSMAKFAHLLANNAITVYNDKYKEYIDLLIDRENSLGDARDKKAIERYTKLIQTYEEEKKILDDILEQQKLIDSSKTTAVTAAEVKETVDALYKLDLTGTILKDFYDVQDSAVKYGLLTSTEKTYTPPEVLYEVQQRTIKFGQEFDTSCVFLQIW